VLTTDQFEEYAVAVGHDKHPTPTGTFTVKRLLWHPAWVPPDAKWAEGKKAAAPGRSNRSDWDGVKGILHMGEQRAVSLATPTPLTITNCSLASGRGDRHVSCPVRGLSLFSHRNIAWIC
jgi:hypothetical protein